MVTRSVARPKSLIPTASGVTQEFLPADYLDRGPSRSTCTGLLWKTKNMQSLSLAFKLSRPYT